MAVENLWGIDLGGTKIEGAILDAGTGKVLFRDRVPTESSKGYEHIVSQICRMAEMMQEAAGYQPSSLGICTPGTLDPPTGTMKNCNTTVLNGQPLKEDLEERLGAKIFMANDANCFALAEARLGVVKERFPDARVVFGVIMGTGVGGGVAINGAALNGLQGIAGEWGHNFLDESGGPCYCGKVGCVEKVLAGPALEKYYEHHSGKLLSLKEIMTLAERGDQLARKTKDRLTYFFGKALSVVINILDPDVIVIGGGVGNIDAIYTEGLDSLRKHIFNLRLDTPIVKPMLGDSAGVFGAALLMDTEPAALQMKGI